MTTEAKIEFKKVNELNWVDSAYPQWKLKIIKIVNIELEGQKGNLWRINLK